MKDKEDSSKRIVYVKAASLADLARLAFTGDFYSKSLFTAKFRKRQRIILLGECISNNVLAYYSETDSAHKEIIYNPHDSDRLPESADFRDSSSGVEKNTISIFDVGIDAFEEGKIEKKSMQMVRVVNSESLVKMAVKAAAGEEALKHLYLFRFNGRQVIGGFDLIDELNDDRRNFYYAFAENADGKGFARYDYKGGGVEFVEKAGEYSYMYVKIINLAEAFPFFRLKQR